MRHSVLFGNVNVLALALATVFSLSGAVANGQVTKPFKITGEGIGPMGVPLPGEEPRQHLIVGNATHLGRHVGMGTVQTDEPADFSDLPNTIKGTFGSGSPFVFEGANGDQLVCEYGRVEHGASEPGGFVLTIVGSLPGDTPEDMPILIVEALWEAEFVPQPDLCTGKFAGVTGSWIMIARSEPFVLGSTDELKYEWAGEGELTFQKKAK